MVGRNKLSFIGTVAVFGVRLNVLSKIIGPTYPKDE